MKIIESENFTKEGNDCFFEYDISLIETVGGYVVIKNEYIGGVWTPENHFKCETKYFGYEFSKARIYFKKLIDKLKI